jgi:predicted O-methyltransferase YrrM
MKKKIFFKNVYRLILNKSKLKLFSKFLVFSLEYYFYRSEIIDYNNKKIDILTKNKKVSEFWFTKNIFFLDKIFNSFYKHKIKYILEIGSFEGISALYFLEKFQDCFISCVDPFTGSDEHTNKKIKSKLEKNFDYNLAPHNRRYKKIKMKSSVFFNLNQKKYDLIYIDGSHRFEDVYNDATEASNCLKKNGLLIFDDYFWTLYDEFLNPMAAINKFIRLNYKSYEIVYLSQQLVLKKK